jgi:hypothetical protein
MRAGMLNPLPRSGFRSAFSPANEVGKSVSASSASHIVTLSYNQHSRSLGLVEFPRPKMPHTWLVPVVEAFVHKDFLLGELHQLVQRLQNNAIAIQNIAACTHPILRIHDI